MSASQNELRDIARRSATQGLLALARGLAALAEGDNTTAAREMVLGRAFVDGARAAQQALYERVMDRAQAHRVEALKRGDVLATRTTRGWPQVECPTLAGTTWLRGPPVPLP